MKRAVFLLALVGLAAMADDPNAFKQRLLSPLSLKETDGDPAPMLLNLARGQSTLEKQDGSLPHRVFGVYHKGAKAWVYTLTTFHGEFTKPLELLYKGTVLPGKYLGAANPIQKYKLTDQYRWVPTDEKETILSVMPDRPNELKRIHYVVPPIHRDVFDTTLPKKK